MSQACVAQSVAYRRLLAQSLAWSIFFLTIDESHNNRTHSSVTTVHGLDVVHVGKQPLALKEYCEKYQ